MVAITVSAIEAPASVTVGPGKRFSASPSGQARKGIIVVRKRGPMKPPPKGR